MSRRIDEPGTKRLQGYEQGAMWAIFSAMDALADAGGIDRRLKELDLTEDYEGVRQALRDISAAILKTVPQWQCQQMERNMQNLELVLGVKSPAARDDKNFGRWISTGAIMKFTDMCREHCQMCDKDHDGQVKCEYRHAMDELPVDLPEQHDACPYFTLWATRW